MTATGLMVPRRPVNYSYDLDPVAEAPIAVSGSWFGATSLPGWHSQWLQVVSPLVGAYVEYVVPLLAGVYTVHLYFAYSTNLGICDSSLDGTVISTIDTYAASYNPAAAPAVVTGVPVRWTGDHRFRMISTGKHASSSSFYNLPQHISFQRSN